MPRVLRAEHLHPEFQHLVEDRRLSEILIVPPAGNTFLPAGLQHSKPRQGPKNAGQHGEAWEVMRDGLSDGVHDRTGRGKMVGPRPFVSGNRQAPKSQPGMMLRPELQRVPVEILKVHPPEHGLEQFAEQSRRGFFRKQ